MQRVKLWKIRFEHPRHINEIEYVTVHAPNAKCAIDKASKITYLTPKAKRRSMITDVTLIGVSEN